ncbi:MAG: hypothetical protein ABIS50_19940 [Luteolibacter sp.]|uniref:hypothetical protein n=1 Tax=Luteolibacter sp. TaxID=1962973 RepID=UPI003264A049
MKPPVSPHMVALLILSAIAPLSAQNLESTPASPEIAKADAVNDAPRFHGSSDLPEKYEVPEIEKAQGIIPNGKPVFAAQDVRNLDTRASNEQKVESVIDLSVLRNPSPFRKVAVSTGSQPYEVSTGSLQNGLALISAVYRESGKKEAVSDCSKVALSVEQRVKLDVAKVLEVVQSEVAANAGCSCEVVKTAIKSSDADVQLVVSIVETAITASPENMRMISQCAIATMPEAVAEVQALLARLDPNSGDADVYSSKSSKDSKDAKDAKVAAIVAPEPPNPLDLPPAYPPILPPPIFPPPVTDVNPHSGHYN